MWRRAYAGNIACGDPSWVSAGQRDVVPTHPVLLQHIRENQPGAPRRSTDIRRVRCGFLMEQRRVGADVDEAALAVTGAPACVTEAHHTIQAAAVLRLVNWLCGLMRQRHIDFQEHRGRGTKDTSRRDRTSSLWWYSSGSPSGRRRCLLYRTGRDNPADPVSGARWCRSADR